jgi:D-glycero-D-manno-heptose 1,7-bisphosphate phosphatase
LSGPFLVDGVGCWCDIRRTFGHMPALFLDRDGVVVEEAHYLAKPEDVRIIAGAAAAIAACNRAGIPVVVVTNQSGIGRGLYDWHAFADVEAAITELLVRDGAHLDAVLACAHHADAQPPYDVADHPWRKPQPGMILEAAARMNLDLARSWIVGDKADDLAAGRTAGLAGGVVVATGHGRDHEREALDLARPGFSTASAISLGEAIATLRPLFGR